MRAFFRNFYAARQRKKTEKSKKKDKELEHATTLRSAQGLPGKRACHMKQATLFSPYFPLEIQI
jgi:hypothetical protein